MRWRLILIAAPCAVIALAIALLAASWHGGWSAVTGAERLRAFDLDVNRYGMSPSILWLADPPRLILAPESFLPRTETVEEVFIVPLKGDEAAWQRVAPADLADAVSVRWSIPREIDQEGDGQHLPGLPDRSAL